MSPRITCTKCNTQPEQSTHKGDEVHVCACDDIKFRRVGR